MSHLWFIIRMSREDCNENFKIREELKFLHERSKVHFRSIPVPLLRAVSNLWSSKSSRIFRFTGISIGFLDFFGNSTKVILKILPRQKKIIRNTKIWKMTWSKFRNDYLKWILLNGTRLQVHCIRQIMWWIRLGSISGQFYPNYGP